MAVFLLFGALALISSCKPINIFSPFVDPSKMGNDAKMDAGYDSLASGNYDDAIDYFSSVINTASGNQLTDAYIGRASAYMKKASPNLSNVVQDLMEGNIQLNDPSDIIGRVISNNEYDSFFTNIQKSADDYNSATQNSVSKIDKGVLLEAYQANMAAATGVGARAIAMGYNESPWGPTEITPDEEMDEIVRSDGTHPYGINTWKDPVAADNGLRQYVAVDEAAKNAMLGYLTNAYNAAEQLKSSPPTGMTQQDFIDMQTGINDWVTNGLGEPALS